MGKAIQDRRWFRIVVVTSAGLAFTTSMFKFWLGVYLAVIIIRLWDLR